jgi:hypothetical protein
MTTTAHVPVHTPPARTLRRVAAAVGMAGFSAPLVVQAVVDPAQGGTGEVMFRAATQARGALFASALLLLGSALLTIPAVAGLLHQARDRGARELGRGVRGARRVRAPGHHAVLPVLARAARR